MLATGSGRVQERLSYAALELIRLRADDFPDGGAAAVWLLAARGQRRRVPTVGARVVEAPAGGLPAAGVESKRESCGREAQESLAQLGSARPLK